MNGQAEACQNSAASQPDQSANGGTSGTLYNICPKGWRLPTGGGATGEYAKLNTAINGGSTSSPSGLLTNGLFMYSGYFSNGSFGDQGASGVGSYWSSTVYGAALAYSLALAASSVSPANNVHKGYGRAVRCVAS